MINLNALLEAIKKIESHGAKGFADAAKLVGEDVAIGILTSFFLRKIISNPNLSTDISMEQRLRELLLACLPTRTFSSNDSD